MSDLSAYCAAAKGPTVALMKAMFEFQRDASRAGEVARQVDALLAAQSLWPTGAVGHAWALNGATTLKEIRAAADSGDAALAWQRFASPESGLHLIGQACQGQDGW